jgi:hypothetical protein
MGKLSLDTCVAALNGCAMSRKAAFQTEISVGLAVFAVSGAANTDAKRALKEIYASAGYDCLRYADQDYKTVNRYINNAANLFNKIGAEAVCKWIVGHTEASILLAVSESLRPLELTMQRDIERLCNPLALVKRTATAVVPIRPVHSILQGPASAFDVSEMIEQSPAIRKISTLNLTLAVPATVTYEELIEMATQLLAMSDQMRKAA